MPEISLMIHTASADGFLREQGIPSYFAALLANLRSQTFRGFELVYVDTFHEANRKTFLALAREVPFVVKHVAVHPAHRYWFDKGHCYISAAKNTGILYADGELLITCDDAELFPSGFLEAYWRHYSSGRYMHALHKRMRSVRVEGGLAVSPPDGDVYVNDYRWRELGDEQVRLHRHGSWLYAGTSFSLADALTLNGFNERMDGYSSLEDCDFGCRLQWLGRSFALDAAGHVFILDHRSYSEDTTPAEGNSAVQPSGPGPTRITSFVAVENYGVLLYATELVDVIANQNPLTPRHMEIIRRETLKYRKFDPLEPENAEKLAVWLGTPTFNLKQQRDELRRSAAWRW